MLPSYDAEIAPKVVPRCSDPSQWSSEGVGPAHTPMLKSATRIGGGHYKCVHDTLMGHHIYKDMCQ